MSEDRLQFVPEGMEARQLTKERAEEIFKNQLYFKYYKPGLKDRFRELNIVEFDGKKARFADELDENYAPFYHNIQYVYELIAKEGCNGKRKRTRKRRRTRSSNRSRRVRTVGTENHKRRRTR